MENMQSFNMPFDETGDLCLTTFGHSVTQPGHTYGPAVRSYYLIHFILAGKGTFTVNQHTYHLHAGQGFLIEPDYQTIYQSDKNEPWTYIWAAFNGKRASSAIASLGLSQNEPIFSCTKKQGDKLANYVREMLANNSFSLAGVYYRLGLLLQFLSVLAEAQRELLPPADNNIYITHMTNFIRTHIEDPFTIQDLADYMNLNRSYVTTLFKKYLHISPHEYIQNCRITKAQHLLESTTLPVEAIAFSCGYAKSDSFSRAFLRKVGMSPKEYRRQQGSGSIIKK
ncbi:helix-turn-helix domain-containing protein [Mitsuokella sp. WILCCON 0060]|uniref:helix-turn-helix domain-containing protein n=1 Tax=Mitsuokella sp. WILCCON 0060 TaxID=3345341 RepID=UPI003F195507